MKTSYPPTENGIKMPVSYMRQFVEISLSTSTGDSQVQPVTWEKRQCIINTVTLFRK